MLWTQLTCVWDTQLSTLLTLPVKTPGPHGPTIRTRRADFSLARSKEMEAYAAACSRRPAGWLPARGRGQQPFRTCVGDVLQHTLSPRRRGAHGAGCGGKHLDGHGSRRGFRNGERASSCHLSSRSPGAWGPRDCQRAPLSQAPGPHLTMHSRTECHSGDTPWSHCPGSTPGSTSNLPAPGLPPPRFPRLYIEDDSDCHKELDEPKSAKPLEQCLVYSEHHISAHQAKLPRF